MTTPCFGINGYQTILLVDIDLTRFGPWYGNVASEIEDFKKSILKIIDLHPKVGISSHLIDPVTDELESRLRSYLAIFHEHDERIVRNIAEGADTVKKHAHIPTIYPIIPSPCYIAFEEFMLEKHIDLLVKKGRITSENGRLSIERM
jgi:hypothetical protein